MALGSRNGASLQGKTPLLTCIQVKPARFLLDKHHPGHGTKGWLRLHQLLERHRNK